MDKGLALKIYNVMCATEGLEKELTVGKGQNSYRAIGERTVLNMIKPLFKEQRLLLLPKDGTIEENVFAYKDGYDKNKLRAVTQLKVYFTIVDIDTGESTDIIGFGNGADSQDKGSGKAFTYALKTALSKTFMLFSGEDTDNTHSDDIGKPSAAETRQHEKEQAQEKKEVLVVAQGLMEELNVTNDQIKTAYGLVIEELSLEYLRKAVIKLNLTKKKNNAIK